MNFAQVARLLAGFALFFSVVQCCMIGIAWFEVVENPEFRPVHGFVWGAGVGLAIALGLGLWGRGASHEFFRRESLLVVGLAWFVAGALGGIPFWASGTYGTYADGIFECISGLTTTGASVCGSGDNHAIEDLPRSILLWRSLVQWIGGIGIILVFIVLLPAMGVTGKNLLASEQVGVSNDDIRPSMRLQARSLFRLYVGLTACLALILWIHGHFTGTQTGFDSICHAFTTMATGGFSTNNLSIGGLDSVFVECVLIVFMFLAGSNFVLLSHAIRGRSIGRLFQSAEFKLYLKLVIGLILAVTLILWIEGGTMIDHATTDRDYDDPLRCLRDAAFQVVSIITTTGYGTADFQNWPHAAVMLIFLTMFFGGCTGSTAGGYKILRLFVVGRLLSFTARKFIRPKSVEKLKLDDDVVPNSVVSSILALFVMWVSLTFFGGVALSFVDGLSFSSALSTSLSMMSCVGPAISEVVPTGPGTFETVWPINVGPYGGFGDLPSWAKLVAAFEMVLGRLEILAPIVLFAPGTWRR
ncbi:MAG: TrkH family potassium uptake protein [Planctomycetes bacterium]|nr:TrkH family potassium uptake protein [Planctomycetota bacterium]